MQRVGRCCSNLWTAFTRTKSLDQATITDSSLSRCLSVVDLIALGVGSTLGPGIYILAGEVAKEQAGPAVVISFIIAAFASFLAGLCYAEFAARVPKAGSAYVYSYVSVGELWALIIGWNMILENMIGAASSGKAWTQFLDSLFNDTIHRAFLISKPPEKDLLIKSENALKLNKYKNLLTNSLSVLCLLDELGGLKGSLQENLNFGEIPLIGPYPDFVSMALLLLATVLVAIGVKVSSNVNLVFTVINLIVIACIVGVGLAYADIRNWTEPSGVFFHKKFSGIIKGAATCFYAFVGFDTISSSGEESRNPTVHVPIAIISTLVICLLCFVGVSSVITLLVPVSQLAESAALPKAFSQRGIQGAEYVIAVGGLCGLTAAIMGSLISLPRGVYSMAQDGLIFKWLGHVSNTTNTPLIATIISGILVALSGLLFDLDSLIEMMSIGTLMAYTLVATSVLVLHYQREFVGLTADSHVNVDSSLQTTDGKLSVTRSTSSLQASNGTIPHELLGSRDSRMSLSEDTGLLRVGDGSNRIRYVPTKTTTVVKRIKPQSDSDEEPGMNPPLSPKAPTSPKPPPEPQNIKSPSTQSSVVEEYRAKVQQQRQQQEAAKAAAAAAAENSIIVTQDGQSLNANHRALSSYSVNSISQLFNIGEDCVEMPTTRTRRVVIVALGFIAIFWTALCLLVILGERFLLAAEWWAIVVVCLLAAAVLVLIILIVKQPRNKTKLNFATPLVPILPLLSIMINIYLMLTLKGATWIRFAIWMTAGFLIYFGYGLRHSSERDEEEDKEVILYDVADKDNLIVDAVYR